jgi:hypothetical protein
MTSLSGLRWWGLVAGSARLGCEEANLDLSRTRDKSLEDLATLEDPDLIAEEIADDLEVALEQFAAVAADLRYGRH